MKDRGELYHNPDAPEGPDLPDSFWKNAVWVDPQGKTSVHLKLDPEVFFFFKQQGKGHITRMQDVLKAYVKAQREREASSPEDDRAPGRAASR
ncbi:BrnA antitoxin family protein [Devosia sp. SL43]|nr:BrnA antitoxin family protein [Devosia sp. SL43]